MKSYTPAICRFFPICFLCLLSFAIRAQQDTIKASFPGGMDSWRRYLEHNLHYPVAAQHNNTQGTVRIQMMVDEQGKIATAQALNDPGDGLAQEAERVVKSGPAWIPATQDGKPINTKFVQTITFRLGNGSYINTRSVSRAVYAMPSFLFSQNIVIKTRKLYKGQPIVTIATTEDLSGVDVRTADLKSYFISRAEAMQELGLLVTDKGFVVPETDTVLYYNNNGEAMYGYKGFKFVGGNRSFRINSLYKKGTTMIDADKEPVIILNGQEVTAEAIKAYQPFMFRGSSLLRIQDEPASRLGSKAQNGILILSTKLPYPDNYLYLLDGKESSNEAIAAIPPGTVDSLNIRTGKMAVEMYGEKAKYGVVRCLTRTPGNTASRVPVFTKATSPAIFPGGEEGWKNYLAANLHYPSAAKKNNLEAEIRVRVELDSTGTVMKVWPFNDPGNGLAQEAIRLFKEGPQWTPANLNGKKVAFAVMMVVPFKLDDTRYN